MRNQEIKDAEALARALAYEESEAGKEILSKGMGWSWQDVQVYPATLSRLLVNGYLKVVYRSSHYTDYALTEEGRRLAASLQDPQTAEQAEQPQPPALHDGLFEGIVGHDDVKELLKAALKAARPVHVLLAGPPALAKSLFLMDLEAAMAGRAHWLLGSASTRAGINEMLEDEAPWMLLADEMDKLSSADQAALLSVMDGGRYATTKFHRHSSGFLDLRVVGTCNWLHRLSPELRSRFAVAQLQPYSSLEYRRVVETVLIQREGTPLDQAAHIAQALAERSQDVRDAIRVARLAPSLGVERAIALLMP